ncbi:apolipoprotein N-acyltransferase [Aestuariimicrobium ganziense]|uniref:apolipoprotein N-acyltransferase n=1 Tax=Aestuariimicrobium ganziense TaxID=2773677 RepID=UPI00194274B9|nr:apolipoprotein N-acyltransferase [Aestuariimicrobium ganziense]
MTAPAPTRSSTRQVRIVRSVALVGAGGLTSLAFAPAQWWPLALVGVALFFRLVRHDLPQSSLGIRSGLARGYLFGLGFQTALVGWVSVLGWWIGVVLVLVMAGFQAVTGAGVALTRRSRWWPIWAAAAWSFAEFCAARFPVGGFPWFRLAWTTADQPLGGYLPWLSVAGVSFLVALVAALLVMVAERDSRRQVVLATAGVVTVAGLGAGLWAVPLPNDEGDTVAVGMVQGNVDGTAGSQAMGYARSVTNNHLSETITLMARARTGLDPMPTFVLWPENSTDIDPTHDAETAALVGDALRIADRPILMGIAARGPGPGQRQTTGLWWDPEQGVGARYDKRNLVPFGEYIPLRDLLLPLLPILEQVGSQGVPGTRPGVLPVNVDGRALVLGDVICFELAYDGTVYDTVRGGAQLVLVQSNNATYTGTGQPRQQFQITRVRAIELRREVVVATTSSFSGSIDPKGRVLDVTDEATAAARTYTVPTRTGVSLAARIGTWVDWGLAALATVGMGWALVGRRRSGATPAG